MDPLTTPTLAAELTDEQFENFLATTDGTVRFADASTPPAKKAEATPDSSTLTHRHRCLLGIPTGMSRTH